MTLTWAKAHTVADLGHLMALWLEGKIPSRPGYYGSKLDPETTPDMVRTLAATCRAGFVTTDSQPGCDEIGLDNARWQQRPAVHGVIADRILLATLQDAAHRTGLQLVVDAPQVVVTKRDGTPYTAFGGVVSRADLRREWDGIGRPAWGQIRTAHQVAVIDPNYGPGERLWTVLDQIARRYR